ncbi:MAG: ATP-grasp domain-containing protein [Gemmatimonadota bacterium]
MIEPSVIVTDGEQRASLAVVRSLGAAGWTVRVVAEARRSLAGASRFAASRHAARSPLRDPVGFLEELTEVVRKYRPSVVLPVSEAALLAVSRDPSRLAPASVPFPPLETVLRASDKGEIVRLAQRLGIAVPHTVCLDAPRTLSDDELTALGLPIVIKPARSVRPLEEPGVKFSVKYARDAAELAESVAAMPAAAFPLLLQRRVVGPGVGVFLLVDRGDVLATFAHRRIRERPPSGGVSVYRQSAPLSEELRESALALLAELDWSGVAMVEFKLDEAMGVPHVMEVNPRLWGSLQLAVDAGVDFPLLLAEWAIGNRPEVEPHYAVDVGSRWLWGEVDHLIARVRAGNTFGIRGSFAVGAATLREQLRGRGSRTRLEVLRVGDPKPFLAESARWVRDLFA